MKTISILTAVLALVACGGEAPESELEDQDLRSAKLPLVTCTLWTKNDWEYRTFYYDKTSKKASYKVKATFENQPAEIEVKADKKGILFMGFKPTGEGAFAEEAPADGSWLYTDNKLRNSTLRYGHSDLAAGYTYSLECEEVTMSTLETYQRIPFHAEPVAE